MNYLLDTCYLSEFVKPQPDPGVVEWGRRSLGELYVSALTIGELEKGIAKLPDSARRTRLVAWMEDELLIRFRDRILAIDCDVARRWGVIQASAVRAGTPLPVIDALIGATAIVHDLQVVTRNETDLLRTGVQVVNPWSR
ncbi:MAG: putative nucleic acid-binding protein [Rhodothermales bacterium]